MEDELKLRDPSKYSSYKDNTYGGSTYGTNKNSTVPSKTYGEASIYKGNSVEKSSGTLRNAREFSTEELAYKNDVIDYKTKELDYQSKVKDANNTFSTDTVNNIQLGIGITKDIIGTVMAVKNYNQRRDEFKFNKKMATKNFNLAKDAYDRKVSRGNSIANQMRRG